MDKSSTRKALVQARLDMPDRLARILGVAASAVQVEPGQDAGIPNDTVERMRKALAESANPASKASARLLACASSPASKASVAAHRFGISWRFQ
mgnify:CR=1 FL=1